MLMWISYGYKAAKPRPMTDNMRALVKYRQELRQTRRNIQIESEKYQDRIETEFLNKHQEQMRIRHFDNQCKFRATLAAEAYRLTQQLTHLKTDHDQKMQKFEKYIHTEEVKKMNRERIKNILEYESNHYWLFGDRISELGSESILPGQVATTQYYHKLYSQALAYQNLEFELLHKFSSDEETNVEKNKLLMPVYKDVVRLIRKVKSTPLSSLQNSYEAIKKQAVAGSAQFKQIEAEHDRQLRELFVEFGDEGTQRTYLMDKLKLWVVLLKKWKQYTEVLSLTSVEVRKIMDEQALQERVNLEKKNLKQALAEKKKDQFVDVAEEDTEQEEVSLEEYMLKNKPRDQQFEVKAGLRSENAVNPELQKLLAEQAIVNEQVTQQLKGERQKLKQAMQSQSSLAKDSDISMNEEEPVGRIEDRIRNFKQTTTSIEALKERYSEDEQIKSLLDAAGQILIDYPKLFKKVWDEQVE